MLFPYRYDEEEEFEKGFAEYYEKHIVPIGKKHEPSRNKRQIIHFFNIIIAGATGLGTSWAIIKSAWFAKAASNNRKSGNILLLPPMFCWWFFVHRPRRKYFNALKEDIVPLILKFIGDFKYSVSGNISEKILKTHTGYSPTGFNMFSCEDVISYNNDGYYCTILERTFWDIKKPTGKIFIYIKSKQSFGIDAVIISRKRDKTNKITDAKLLKKRKLNTSPILVNSTFDKFFKLHTNNDQINKWISESFIKTLINLNYVFDKDGLVFSVKDNSIFIELESSGNFFEVGTSHNVPVANVSDIRNLLKELIASKNLVDEIIDITAKAKNEPKNKKQDINGYITVDSLTENMVNTAAAANSNNEPITYKGRQ